MGLSRQVATLSLFIFVGIGAPHAAIQNEEIKPSQTKQKSVSSEQIRFAQLEEELLVLREQNKLIREYQGNLIDTVYMAFSAVFGTALLLAGFSWWSNFKLYEKDQQRLEDKLASRISGLETRLNLKLEENKGELEKSTAAMAEIHLTRLTNETNDVRNHVSAIRLEHAEKLDKLILATAELKGELSTSQVDFLAKLDALNTTLESETSALSKNQTDSKKQLDRLIASNEEVGAKLKALEKEDAKTLTDLRLVEEHMWELKNIPANIIVTQFMALRATLRADSVSDTKYVLERMQKTLLTHYKNKGVKISKPDFEFYAPRLKEMEKRLEPVAAVEFAAVKTLFEELKS